MSPYLRNTRSICPECQKLVSAEIYEDGPGLAMRRFCPIHGDCTITFLKDKSFYLAIERHVDRSNEGTAPDDWRGTYDHAKVSRDLYIDVTERCNLHCQFCFTNSTTGPSSDLTKEEIFSGVDRLPNRRIVISLLGGEPTLREDLPEIIRYITGRGHVLKLLTNGVLLTDERIAELRRAGLRWVTLQFDGFSDDIYEQLRSRPLLQQKMAAIERLSRHGMFILLASCIVRGVNDDQVGKLLHFGMSHPNIVQIGLLPASDLGRSPQGFGTSDIETPEMIRLLEEQTGGRIRQSDFVRSVWEGHLYTRVTGNRAYKARTCCNGIFLYHDGYAAEEVSRWATESDSQRLHEGKTILPIDRALTSLPGLRHPSNLMGALRTITRWNHAPIHKHLFGVVIEKFRNRNKLDFDDAKNCSKVYLTREGFLPNCLYNILYRERCWGC